MTAIANLPAHCGCPPKTAEIDISIEFSVAFNGKDLSKGLEALGEFLQNIKTLIQQLQQLQIGGGADGGAKGGPAVAYGGGGGAQGGPAVAYGGDVPAHHTAALEGAIVYADQDVAVDMDTAVVYETAPRLEDLPEIKSEGNHGFFAQHGGYKKIGDGTYEITKGTYAGYTLKWNDDIGKMVVYDKHDCAVGVTDGKGGKDKVASPIAFDMNGDGKIGVTGETTAKDGMRSELGQTVEFDIDADGQMDTIEWMAGDGDALLVDNRDGKAAGDMDGARLFGDQGGTFANGYEKLSKLDINGDGTLTGAELQGLMLWSDNGNAKVDAGEMISAQEAGVTSISTGMTLEKNDRGEDLMRSSAEISGQAVMTEDVWFGQDS